MILPEMSSVCDSDWSRDYHDDTGSRVALSGTRFVSQGGAHPRPTRCSRYVPLRQPSTVPELGTTLRLPPLLSMALLSRRFMTFSCAWNHACVRHRRNLLLVLLCQHNCQLRWLWPDNKHIASALLSDYCTTLIVSLYPANLHLTKCSQMH